MVSNQFRTFQDGKQGLQSAINVCVYIYDVKLSGVITSYATSVPQNHAAQGDRMATGTM